MSKRDKGSEVTRLDGDSERPVATLRGASDGNSSHLDLERLVRVAAAAWAGPWGYQEASDAYTHIVRQGSGEVGGGPFLLQLQQDRHGGAEANARHIAAFNPATVLALLAELTEARKALEPFARMADSLRDWPGDEETDAPFVRHVIGRDEKGRRTTTLMALTMADFRAARSALPDVPVGDVEPVTATAADTRQPVVIPPESSLPTLLKDPL